MNHLDHNYNRETLLSKWWEQVKSNFKLLEQHTKDAVLDHPDGSVIRDKLSTAVKSELDGLRTDVNKKAAQTYVDTELLKKADQKTTDGGFAGGENASVAWDGAAVGKEAQVTKSDGKYGRGFAGGYQAKAKNGGASGSLADTFNGGSAGNGAYSYNGGAIGSGAKTTNGFAGGQDAVCENNGGIIDAVQLGTGRNDSEKTFQVYDYRLMNADGSIPMNRLRNAQGGFSAGNGAGTGGSMGNGAYTSSGCAAGEGAHSEDGAAAGKNAQCFADGGACGKDTWVSNGGAVGSGAVTGDGFAGGYNAQCMSEEGGYLDNIQLGTGTNGIAKTLQVYDFRMMNADGSIPVERIPELAIRIFDHTEENAKAYDCKETGMHILHHYSDMPWITADLPEEEAHGVLFVYDCGNGTGDLAKTLIGESGKVYRGTDNSELLKTEWMNPLESLEARIAALEGNA